MQSKKHVLRLPALAAGLALCAPLMAQDRTIPEYDDVRVDYPGSDFVRDIAGEDRFYFRFGACTLSRMCKPTTLRPRT